MPGVGDGASSLAVADPWVGVINAIGGCEVPGLAVRVVAAWPSTGPGSNTTTGTSISLGAPATEEKIAAVGDAANGDARGPDSSSLVPSCALAAPTLLQPFNSAPAPLVGNTTASAPAPPRPLVRASSDAAALMSLSAARHAAELGAAAAATAAGDGASAARLSDTGAGGAATMRQPGAGAGAVAGLSGMQPGMSTGGAAIARAVLHRTRSNGTHAMQTLVAAAAGAATGGTQPPPPVRPPSMSGTPSSSAPWNALFRNSNSRRWGTPPSGSSSATRPPSAGSTPPTSVLQPSGPAAAAAAVAGTAVTLGPPPLVSIRTARRASTSFIGLGSLSPGLHGAPFPNAGSNPGPGAGAGAGGAGGRQTKRLLRRQSTNARLQQLLTTYSELVNPGTAMEERTQLMLMPSHPEDGSAGADGVQRLQGVKAVAVAAMAAEGLEATRSGALPSLDTARSELGRLLSIGSIAAAAGQSPAYAMGLTQSSAAAVGCAGAHGVAEGTRVDCARGSAAVWG